MSSLLAAPACVVDATGETGPSTQEPDASSIESTAAALTLNPTATQLVSFQSYNYPDHYIRHADFLGELATIGGDGVERLHATFRVVPGLTRQGAVSLESVNLPGYYLRHAYSRLTLQKNDGSNLFAKDASFYPRSGLAGAGTTSFEAVNFPGSYLRHSNYHFYLHPNDGSGLFSADASFRAVDPLAMAPGASAGGQCRVISGQDTSSLSCNANEIMVSGGGTCHAEWDQHLAESRPTGLQSLTVACVNHNNSSIVNAPATISAVCCRSELFPGAYYVDHVGDAPSISCRNDDPLAFGGASCHSGDWDQRLLKSLPSSDARPGRVDFRCMNHDNSGLQNDPARQSAVCIPNAQVSKAPNNDRPWCAPRCDAGQVLLGAGGACHDAWDEMLLSSRPTSTNTFELQCMNHENSSLQHGPQLTSGFCFGAPAADPPASAVRPLEAPDWAETMARRYAPIFVPHPNESYWPMDPRDYIAGSRVMFPGYSVPPAGFDECADKLDRIGEISFPWEKLTTYLAPTVDGRLIFDYMGGSPSWADCSVAPMLCGTSHGDGAALNAVPVFAILSDKPAVNAVDVYYWAFFAYNQGKNVAGTNWESHFGDWVHASIRFDRNSGQPTMLYMDHHGDRDEYSLRAWSEAGKRVDANTGFEVTPDGRPVIYLAQGSHEPYPSPGAWSTKGNTHDFTADGPLHWDTRASMQLEWIHHGVIRSGQGNNWLNYNGRYGIPEDDCTPEFPWLGRACRRAAGAPSPSPTERAFMTSNGSDPDA